MNIDLAIELHRTALLRLMTVMFSAVGVEEGGSVGFVKQHVRLMVLRLLGPAESALRRLIFLKARGMAALDYVRGPAPEKAIPRGEGRSKRRAFPLFDKRKTFGGTRNKRPVGPGPQISFFDGSDRRREVEPEKSAVLPDDPVSAESLCQRLNAMLAALNDLDKQAKRLKRAEARRKLLPRLSGQGVLRIHLPPGNREKGNSPDEIAVDDILRECQILARRWIVAPDTS